MKKIISTLFLTLGLSAQAQTYQGAWALYDYSLQEYQVVFNRTEIRPIASITKLFTATTIIREGLDLDEKVKVQGRSNGRFPKGTMVTRHDLLKAMLISSDNLAAETLANTFPGGFDNFIVETNRWVKGFGMTKTEIVDASGLLSGNVSNIDNLVILLHKVKDIPAIRKIASDRTDTLNLQKNKKKTIKINLHNTNPTLFHFDNILVSKTGFTNAAGRCVVMLVDKGERLYAVIILGQKNVQERSKIAEDLINKKPMPVPPPAPITFDFDMPWQ